ncbi:hypothetical protein [Roseivirga thermotolerans]|uniref:Uncharacterized protein n=1 Tax=Roseivirga thermotolerans TaxID=1758176 RepID=A0ABQ3I7F2_9BACT|nr:hypothetical protein [Roseivirga thermotolerans]GHE65140.1 hypothetical protein GCM10011340_20250 [Roseivirga thermotolerans]
MKIGTKSILIGAHCFFIHPWFVAYSWYKLYGFPFDPRLWLAFFVHDLGYIGKPNMDGEEGELHPYWGANLMGFLFGFKWFEFTLYHSRFLAKKNGASFSKLCVADKLAIVYTPSWLYLPMVRMTGEIHEYMKDSERNSNGTIEVQSSQKLWFKMVKEYVWRWVQEHKDLREDSWTPTQREAVNQNGVWK